MKMPRSHCEAENVNFVQELAEVDGPFESPIDINFRDLAKLELPSLVWNRSAVPPKKMKITNTGHTVIISGKWKCERPYLTGGPLLGKYVFSQIHFHWGQDERRGSEHQICGEGFPLEMHVAHFKAEYATQENALREKDGMVVLVYLFKIQEEPNACLKSIINLLPNIHQPSTSHHIDPRPILSLCNPFTDDYFMYWGSVVTSTCAHILLWIVSREPFGISREQVNEFRKILDSSQQPINRNSRELQPLHKRNVFHVNASKNLDQALLPIKKIYRCYCRGSEEDVCETECNCRSHRNQEEIQENSVENLNTSQNRDLKGKNIMNWTNLSKDFRVQHTYVHSATIQSTSLMVKKFESEQAANMYYTESVPFQNSEKVSKIKLVSYSCCFVPAKDTTKTKKRLEKRKNRDKKKHFKSIKALSHILNSLEIIKNHTFRKLKEIESINEEIKGIKPLCSDTEDKKWLRTIEKIMSRQKQFTMKASRGCINEIKNLATECNLDKIFDKNPPENFPVGDHNSKVLWENMNGVSEKVDLTSKGDLKNMKDLVLLQKEPFAQATLDKAIKFSDKTQKLLERFFEDIKETEDLHQTVQQDLQLKKITSLYKKQAGDCTSVEKLLKEGFITQKLFNLGNLEDRFFTEVITEDQELEKNTLEDEESKPVPVENEVIKMDAQENQVIAINPENVERKESTCHLGHINNEDIIPLRRAINTVLLSHEVQSKSEKNSNIIPNLENFILPYLHITDSTERYLESEILKAWSMGKWKTLPTREVLCKSFEKKEKLVPSTGSLKDVASNNLFKNTKNSSSSTSTARSLQTHKMIIQKIHKMLSKQSILEPKASVVMKNSLKGFSKHRNHRNHKNKNNNFENINTKRKKSKSKRKKMFKGKKLRTEINFSKTSTTTSKEAFTNFQKKCKWKKLAKAKFDLEEKKTTEAGKESAFGRFLLSKERKKLKLNSHKINSSTRKKRQQHKQLFFSSSDSEYNVDSKKYNDKDTPKKDNELMKLKKKESVEKIHTPRRILGKPTEPGGTLTHKKNHIIQVIKESSQEPTRNDLRNIAFNNQEDYLPFKPIKIGKQKTKISQPPPRKLTFKNKSLTNLTNKVTCKFELNQRVFVENFENRQKSARESFNLFKKIKNKQPNEETTSVKTLNQESVHEVPEDKEPKEVPCNLEVKKVLDLQSSKIIEYKSECFTAASLIDTELTPRTQKLNIQRYTGIAINENKKPEPVSTKAEEVQIVTNETVKIESKVLFQKEEKSPPVESITVKSKVSEEKKSEPPPVILKAEAKHSSVGVLHDKSKDDEDGQPSNVFKPMSGESLNLLGKNLKRNVKKRPHYNKRNLKYHFKKSSTFKRNCRADKKPISLLLLTEEEQLKIISENVVKYLKTQLAENHPDLETKVFGHKSEEFFQNMESTSAKTKGLINSNVKSEKTTGNKIKRNFYSKKLQEIEKNKYKNCDAIEKQKEKDTDIKMSTETVKKTVPNSQKPTNNFIKLNKLMAGKYKRMRPAESQLEKEKVKNSTITNTVKPPQRRKEKIPSPVENSEQKSKLNNPPTPKKSTGKPSTLGKLTIQNQMKSQVSVKMDGSSIKKPNKDTSLLKTDVERKMEIESVSELQKITPLKRWVPTYMLTSYLPKSITENKKTKLNRYLLKMQSPHFVTNALFDAKKERKENKNDSIVTNDLEYLLKLQMCLNNELSTNVENSVKRVTNIFSQDQNKIGALETTPAKNNVDFLEPCKRILVVGTNSLHKKSNSDTEESVKTITSRPGEQNLKLKEVYNSKTMKESGDSELIISPTRDSDNQDYNSDSSYNCEILITLNSETNEKETKVNVRDSKKTVEENKTNNISSCINIEKEPDTSEQEKDGHDLSNLLKPQRKKRKENEISTEMKQKLLEILEGEIKREMGLSCRSSSENLGDKVSLKWKKTEWIERSQSSGTSSDNAEALTEISETMKQYLSNLKQRCLATRRKNKEKRRRKEREPA